MTHKEALKLALEALEYHGDAYLGHFDEYQFAITKVKEALAQPEQEPVAWITQGGKGWLRWHKSYDDNKDSVPLYTTPPQRTWVGLTDEEIKHIYICTTGWSISDSDPMLIDFAEAIEAKLKEQNT